MSQIQQGVLQIGHIPICGGLKFAPIYSNTKYGKSVDIPYDPSSPVVWIIIDSIIEHDKRCIHLLMISILIYFKDLYSWKEL